MKIEKEIHCPGFYKGTCTVNGIELFALGKSHSEVIDGLFDKIRWAFDDYQPEQRITTNISLSSKIKNKIKNFLCKSII